MSIYSYVLMLFEHSEVFVSWGKTKKATQKDGFSYLIYYS